MQKEKDQVYFDSNTQNIIRNMD